MSGTRETKIGRVKWFNSKRGFGFLTDCDTSEDLFVHFSSIQAPENVYKNLIDGEYVSYSERLDENGKKIADHITGVKGGELLCQNKDKNVYLVSKNRQVLQRPNSYNDNRNRRSSPRKRYGRNNRQFQEKFEESVEASEPAAAFEPVELTEPVELAEPDVAPVESVEPTEF